MKLLGIAAIVIAVVLVGWYFWRTRRKAAVRQQATPNDSGAQSGRFRRLAFVALAVAAVFAVASFARPLIDPHWAQDRCSFGEVTNARYLELLRAATPVAEANRPEFRKYVANFDGHAVSLVLQREFDELSRGLTSIQERIAAMHAVIHANGGDFLGAQPDVANVFEEVGTPGKPIAVVFQYRFDLNLAGLFRISRRWGVIEVYFPLLDSPPNQDVMIFRRNTFFFLAGVQSWLKNGRPPDRSRIHPDCPPVPTAMWEAEFDGKNSSSPNGDPPREKNP